MINRFLLDHKDFTDIPDEDVELIKQRDIKRLQIMEGYCRTSGCLRNYILEYFGEKRNEPCESCGNCHRDFTEIDMTEEAKKVINCVWEAKGRYGMNVIIGTLLGANRARLKELGTINYKTYGALRDRSESELKVLINQMVLDGYLYQTIDKYSVIHLGNIKPLQDEKSRVLIRTYIDKEPERRKRKSVRKSTDSLTKAGFKLFETLRNLRLTIAREEGMPPYIIFSDKALIDMCVKIPSDRASMLRVSGVGEVKYEKYGERFIEAITDFMDNNPESITSIRDDEEEVKIQKKVSKKSKRQKVPFYLNPEDEEKFEYQDLYLLGEIKDELNRITSGDNVKHVFGTDINRFHTERGYVEEKNIDGRFIQAPTLEGQKLGITAVEQTSKLGTVYTVLKYPPAVQKEIVEHYLEMRNQVVTEDDEEEVTENLSFDRVAYNRKMNRPDGAGASWLEEEDKQLEEEFKSGMKISEIAKIHNRTYGAIRARLKRHGMID